MIEYLPHTNPQVDILKANFRGRRGGSKNGLMAVERYGMRLCAWCAKKPLERMSQKFCSPLCLDSSDAFFYPTKSGYPYLLARQGGQCATCMFDWEPILLERWEKRIQKLKEELARCIEKHSEDPERHSWDLERAQYNLTEETTKLEKRGRAFWFSMGIRHFIEYHREPQVDHIVPVALGGDGVGLENVQVLCRQCHAHKTVHDNRLIRETKTANAKRTKEELWNK